jgi:tetratricopeptide (TPR) repeat protein
MSARRVSIFARAIVLPVALLGAAITSAADFAAELDSMWDYGKPDQSEMRFRAELGRWPSDSPQHAEVRTQIARTHSLRRQFAEANAVLDGVEQTLATMPAHVRVRYLLERGRTLNSSGAPERAVPMFTQALDLAECNADPFYAIDAAHMLGIAAPPAKRLDWNLKALAMTERTADARSKRWLGPLYNNIGYTYQERGDFATALSYYRKALPAYEARGDASAVRIAHWTIARAQRSLGQLDEAEQTQRMLLAENEKLGEPDGYVFEELAEIALARGDAAGAKPWAAKAYELLSADQGFAASNGERLAHLANVGGVAGAAAKPAR